MKKFLALALALMIACMMIPAMAEDDVTGEWSGLVFGMPMVLTLSEDGTYTLTAGDQTVSQGPWELKDGYVLMDGDADPANGFLFDGSSLTNEANGATLTREKAEITLAEVNPNAALEDFAGEWTCKYVQLNGMTIDIEQGAAALATVLTEAVPTMKIDGTSITLTGLDKLLGNGLQTTYADGTLTYAIASIMTVSVNLLTDGMAVISADISDSTLAFYFNRVEAAADAA